MSAPIGSPALGVLKVLMMAQHLTFYFLYSKLNPRALRHFRLKTPQTKSCTVRWNGKPLEKFLRDQQVHQWRTRLALRTSGGEMNKWIKPWVSRRLALAQIEAKQEISVYSPRKMEARGYACARQKERERENRIRWDTSKAAVILSGHSMLAHAYPYIHLGSWRTWKQGTWTLSKSFLKDLELLRIASLTDYLFFSQQPLLVD